MSADTRKFQVIHDDSNSSDWMSVEEAAVYLRIFTKDGEPGVHSIRNLVNQGRLPRRKPFGRLLFSRAELRRHIEASRKD